MRCPPRMASRIMLTAYVCYQVLVSDVEIKTSFSGVKFMTCICRESKFSAIGAGSNYRRRFSKVSASKINRLLFSLLTYHTKAQQMSVAGYLYSCLTLNIDILPAHINYKRPCLVLQSAPCHRLDVHLVPGTTVALLAISALASVSALATVALTTAVALISAIISASAV